MLTIRQDKRTESLLPKCPPRTGHPVPCFELCLKNPRRTLKGQSVHTEVTPVGRAVGHLTERDEQKMKEETK